MSTMSDKALGILLDLSFASFVHHFNIKLTEIFVNFSTVITQKIWRHGNPHVLNIRQEHRKVSSAK